MEESNYLNQSFDVEGVGVIQDLLKIVPLVMLLKSKLLSELLELFQTIFSIHKACFFIFILNMQRQLFSDMQARLL